MQQNSPEWFAARCGKVTASRIADVVAKTKTGVSAMRVNYMAELLAERLTGLPVEGFKSDAMKWGSEVEPEARAAYEFYRNQTVTEVGFVLHPNIDQSGASPDGFVGGEGLVEIKCPNTATHMDTLLGQSVPAKYINQMQWQMACADRKWCDFVSYDPRMPEHLRLFVRRVERDDKQIAKLEEEVVGFLFELAVKLAELNRQYGLEEEAA